MRKRSLHRKAYTPYEDSARFSTSLYSVWTLGLPERLPSSSFDREAPIVKDSSPLADDFYLAFFFGNGLVCSWSNTQFPFSSCSKTLWRIILVVQSRSKDSCVILFVPLLIFVLLMPFAIIFPCLLDSCLICPSKRAVTLTAAETTE